MVVGLRSVVDTDNWGGIYIESCTRSQNQGIPGQPGAIRIALTDFPDHLVKESHGRVNVCYETEPVYVQCIYFPCLLVWNWDMYSGNMWFRRVAKRSM